MLRYQFILHIHRLIDFLGHLQTFSCYNLSSYLQNCCPLYTWRGKHFDDMAISLLNSIGRVLPLRVTWHIAFFFTILTGQRSWATKLVSFAFLFLSDPSVITKTWFAFLHLHLFCHILEVHLTKRFHI